MSANFNAAEVSEFIKDNRSNESNFHLLHQKLQKLLKEPATPDTLKEQLQEAETKASSYQAAKEAGTSSWSDFEKFVTAFEKAVLADQK